MAANLQIIINGVDRASGSLKDVGKSLDTLESRSTSLVSKGLGPLSSILGTGLKVAAGAGAVAVGGLVGTIISSTSAAADMQQKIADIAAVMGKATSEIAPLKNLITQLGIDPKLKVSATEAADAIEMLARNGLDMTQIMEGAARNTVLLSNATGADLSTSADIATDAMALFNIEASDMKRAVDGITGVTVNSKFKIEDYALALGTGAKGAVAAGINFDQFNQVLVATSSNFTSGMTAGTSLTAMFLGLSPSTEKSKNLMKELGIITADGTNRFFDMNGQVRSNAEISEVLRSTLGKLAPEQRLNAVNTLFGRDAMAAINGMINTTEDSWKKYGTALAKTDAEQQAATRMNTLRGAMEILSGIFETLRLQIGDKFVPVFQRMVERITEFTSKHSDKIVHWAGILADRLGVLVDRWLPPLLARFEEWIEQAPDLIVQIEEGTKSLAAFIGQVVAVVAPIVRFIAENVGLKNILIAVAALMGVSAVASIVSFVAGIVGAITTVVSFVGALGTAIPALGAVVVAAGPVILIAGAIAAAIAALYLAWQHNFLGIRDKAEAALNFVKGLFADLPGKIAEFGGAFFDRAGGLITRIRDGFNHFMEDPKGAITRVVDGVRDRFNTTVDNLKGHVFPRAGEIVTRIRDGINHLVNDPKHAVNTVLDNVASTFNARIDGSGSLKDRFWTGARDAVLRIRDGFNHVTNDPRHAINSVLDNTVSMFNARIDGSGSLKDRFFAGGRDAVLRIKDGFNHVMNDPRGALESVLNNANNAFNDKVNGMRNHFFPTAQTVMHRIRDAFSSIDIGGDFGRKLNEAISIFNSWKDDFYRHVWEPVKAIGKRVVDGLAQGIRDAFRSLRDALDWIASVAPQWVKDKLGIYSPSKVFADLFEAVPEGMAAGILKRARLPADALAGVTSNMMDSMNGLALPQLVGGALGDGRQAGGNASYDNRRITNNNFNLTWPASGSDRADERAYTLVNNLTAIYG